MAQSNDVIDLRSGDSIATKYATELSLGARDTNTLAIDSDGSISDVVLPPATQALAGLMTGGDKTKLDGITSTTVDTIADLSTAPTDLGAIIVLGYYSVNDGGGGIFSYDATQTAVNDGGIVIDGWVRQYSGAVNVKWFGAKNDKTLDSTDAIKQAALICQNGLLIYNHVSTLYAEGDFMISSQIDLTGITVDFSNAIIYLSNNFTDNIAIYLQDGYGDSVRKKNVKIKADGNIANQTIDIVLFKIYNGNWTGTIYDINGINCHTILQVMGNTENQNINVSGANAEVMVEEKLDPSDKFNTPDEVIYKITGHGIKKAFIQDSSGIGSSSTVIFNIERAGEGLLVTDNIVEITSEKAMKLEGLIRGTFARGIYVNAAACLLDLDITFYGSIIAAPLHVQNVRQLNGSVVCSVSTPYFGKGIFIGKVTFGGSLYAYVAGVRDGASVEIGFEENHSVHSMNINIVSTPGVEGIDLQVNYARNCIINLLRGTNGSNLINGISTEVTFPREYQSKALDTGNALYLKRVIRGQYTTAEILAYPYPKKGLMMDNRYKSAKTMLYSGTMWLNPSTVEMT